MKAVALGCVEVLVVAVAGDDPVRCGRVHRHQLVTQAEYAGGKRNLAFHAGGIPLTVESGMVRADQGGQHEVRLGLLNAAEGRKEIGDIQRE